MQQSITISFQSSKNNYKNMNEDNFVVDKTESNFEEKTYLDVRDSEYRGKEKTNTDDYVLHLIGQTILHVHQEARVKQSYADCGKLVLIFMYLNQQHFTPIREWTNERLSSSYNFVVNEAKFYVYLGFEI